MDVFYDAEEKFSDSEFEASVRVDDGEENSSEDDTLQNGDADLMKRNGDSSLTVSTTQKKISDAKLTPRSQRKLAKYRFVLIKI